MRAIVTCGPSYEPIDEVRRLTNFSTGELGSLLAAALSSAGIRTLCLRGEGATYPAPESPTETRSFSTNEDLARQLAECSDGGEFHAIFHAAALCDYRPASIFDAAGADVSGPKIPTRAGALTIRLEPAAKVLPELRKWFPRASIIGWKYELAGTAEQALAAARDQMVVNHTDACVLNGRAAGAGFQLVRPDRSQECFATKEALCDGLVQRLCGGLLSR